MPKMHKLPWSVCCSCNKKSTHVGRFGDEVEAAVAADAFKIKTGEGARLNFPDDLQAQGYIKTRISEGKHVITKPHPWPAKSADVDRASLPRICGRLLSKKTVLPRPKVPTKPQGVKPQKFKGIYDMLSSFVFFILSYD